MLRSPALSVQTQPSGRAAASEDQPTIRRRRGGRASGDKPHGSGHRDGARHLIERAPAIVPAGALFANAAPLLEEKRRPRLAACGFNLGDPLLSHRTRTRAALAADDCPPDAAQISPSHRPKQRLEGNKSDGSIDLAQDRQCARDSRRSRRLSRATRSAAPEAMP